MFVLMELVGILTIGVFAWVIYRASKARPDDMGLRWAARIAAVAWIAFLVFWIINLEALREDPIGTGINMLILMALVGAVMGYRTVLGRIKDRAGR